jgi:hypothetical protein
MHAEIRLIEMSSRTVWQLNEQNNQWEQISADPPVTYKFNALADERNVNPLQATITQSQYSQANPTRVTVVHVLCAAVITREAQAITELAYREQTQRLLMPQQVVTETTQPGPPALVVSANPLDKPPPTAAPAPNPPPLPTNDPHTPVDVTALGEEMPQAPPPGGDEAAFNMPDAPAGK